MNSVYYKNWYQDNGQTLNQERRKKYQEDPVYKQKVLDLNRKSRRKRKEAGAGELKKEKDATKIKIGGRAWKTIIVDIPGSDGVPVPTPVFSISALAHVLGKSVQLVRIWEKQKKHQAEPAYISPKGDRFYTQETLETLHRIMVQSGKSKAITIRARSKNRAFEKVIVYPDGTSKKTPLFRVGALADLCDRTVVTMQLQESKGRLPDTPFRFSKTQYRLYTLPMMEAVRDALDRRGGGVRGDEAWRIFHDEVLEAWRALGVIGAKLAEFPEEQDDDLAEDLKGGESQEEPEEL